MGLDNTHYKNIMAEVRGMREEVGRIDRDLSRDRQDIEDFKVQMASMKEEIKQLRQEINANASKVKDKVEDALEPARHEVAKLTQEIKKKKTVMVHKKNWFGWLRGGDKK